MQMAPGVRHSPATVLLRAGALPRPPLPHNRRPKLRHRFAPALREPRLRCPHPPAVSARLALVVVDQPSGVRGIVSPSSQVLRPFSCPGSAPMRQTGAFCERMSGSSRDGP